VLIEDIHWGEEQLLDLLERLIRDMRGPLLLIATARPELLEQRPGWGARVRATTLELEALSSEDAARMLDELLGGTLPAGLREVVVQRAEGNPFFVEELLGTLIDRQLLERQNGSWRLAELPSDFAVPDTVKAVVAARVDLLEPAEEPPGGSASAASSGPAPSTSSFRAIRPVVLESDFIRRRPVHGPGGPRAHQTRLTCEVVYASLPRAKRARPTPRSRDIERNGEGRTSTPSSAPLC
jgi:hypothetical protein